MDCSLQGSSVHGIFRQRYWGGLPFPSPEDLPDSVIKPRSTCIAGRRFTLWATRDCKLPSWRSCGPDLVCNILKFYSKINIAGDLAASASRFSLNATRLFLFLESNLSDSERIYFLCLELSLLVSAQTTLSANTTRVFIYSLTSSFFRLWHYRLLSSIKNKLCSIHPSQDFDLYKVVIIESNEAPLL